MKIVIAPDKFKGSLTAAEAAEAIAAGVRRAFPQSALDLCPMADGGEGTVAALVAATGGRVERRRVTGPLPEMKVDAAFGVLGGGQTAVVEMSAASGLALLKTEDRNPLNTTTFGTGELLLAAAALGATHILLGLGGSATTDAGLGAAQACGLPVLLEGAEPASPTEPLCGRDVPMVLMVKHGRGSPVERVRLTVACDVTNPLYGPDGAAAVYGPQKGAAPADVRFLDDALRGLAERTGKAAEAAAPGAGAAGGLGFGMLAYFGATLRSGVEIVIDATGLRRRLVGVDLCLTGEGRLDGQSSRGKTVAGVARACREAGVPCVALAGSIGDGARAILGEGASAYFSICDRPMALGDALREARTLLESAAENVVRLASGRA